MKISLILVFTFFLASCIAGQPTSTEGVDVRNYKELLKRCNGNSCCESSARNMESAKGFLIKDYKSTQCTGEFRPNMLKCPTSYIWCEPK